MCFYVIRIPGFMHEGKVEMVKIPDLGSFYPFVKANASSHFIGPRGATIREINTREDRLGYTA